MEQTFNMYTNLNLLQTKTVFDLTAATRGSEVVGGGFCLFCVIFGAGRYRPLCLFTNDFRRQVRHVFLLLFFYISPIFFICPISVFSVFLIFLTSKYFERTSLLYTKNL